MNFEPETARYPALSSDGKISIKGISSKNLLSSDQNGLVTKNSICDLEGPSAISRHMESTIHRLSVFS